MDQPVPMNDPDRLSQPGHVEPEESACLSL